MNNATSKQLTKLVLVMDAHMIDRDKFKQRLGIQSTKELTVEEVSSLIDHYENLPMIPVRFTHRMRINE